MNNIALANAHLPSSQLAPMAGMASGGAIMIASGNSSMSAQFGVPADDLSPYERDRTAFYSLLPTLLATHAGKYVVISGGRAEAFGEGENDTAVGFASAHPEADFYIGFVGDEPVAHQVRPVSR